MNNALYFMMDIQLPIFLLLLYPIHYAKKLYKYQKFPNKIIAIKN